MSHQLTGMLFCANIEGLAAWVCCRTFAMWDRLVETWKFRTHSPCKRFLCQGQPAPGRSTTIICADDTWSYGNILVEFDITYTMYFDWPRSWWYRIIWISQCMVFSPSKKGLGSDSIRILCARLPSGSSPGNRSCSWASSEWECRARGARAAAKPWGWLLSNCDQC